MDGLIDVVAVAATLQIGLGLLLEWFPGLSTWWMGTFTDAQKKGIMAALVVVISVAVVGIQCGRGGACPVDWLDFVWKLIFVVVLSGGAQQGAFRLYKRV